MKYKSVSIRLKRDVRHARYNVSACEAGLTAYLEEGDDLESVYREVHEDVTIIVEAIVEEEKRDYARSKQVNNQQR